MLKSNQKYEKLKTIPKENTEEINALIKEIADDRFDKTPTLFPSDKDDFIAETLKAIEDGTIKGQILIDMF